MVEEKGGDIGLRRRGAVVKEARRRKGGSGGGDWEPEKGRRWWRSCGRDREGKSRILTIRYY